MYWAATAMPLSRFAEINLFDKTRDRFKSTNTSNKIVGITSALPNEEKSTIAVSLAQLIGHAGKRVIIVDCDLTKSVSIRQSCAERRYHRGLGSHPVFGRNGLEGPQSARDL